MKNIVLAFLLIFSASVFAQNTKEGNIKYVKITQKKCIKKKGYHLVLKEVVSDSRCPEGVTCIWAGDVKVVVSLYQNRKFIEDKTITFSTMHNKENMDWFSNYLPSHQKNIKSIEVLPFPKNGNTLDSKDYFIKIGYLK